MAAEQSNQRKLQPLSREAQTDLKDAVTLLETDTLALRMSEMVGDPVERLIEQLPESWHQRVGELTQSALTQCLRGALKTMNTQEQGPPSKRLHKVMTAVSGGLGGLGGLATVAVELPVSTGLIFRSIADIARSHGEDMSSLESQLACLEVFALGGPSPSDDGANSAYLATRIALAQALRELSQAVAQKGVVQLGAPAVTRLIALIAERFSVQVIEKVSAQLIPALGAIAGATINTIFIDHFQRMAEGHFTLRRLEREYGRDAVRAHYQRVFSALPKPSQRRLASPRDDQS